jgi:hypothetical protein
MFASHLYMPPGGFPALARAYQGSLTWLFQRKDISGFTPSSQIPIAKLVDAVTIKPGETEYMK